LKKELLDAMANINKQFGKGSVMQLGSNAKLDVEVISTGSLAIDVAVGVGGFPRGRIIEIYGPESGGKTTLALHAIAEVQKSGGDAAFVDAEHALDPQYARALGVDTDALIVAQPESGEKALEITEALIKGGADIVVVDSVAALVPQAELDGDMGQAQMGLQARLMSQALRKLTGAVSQHKASLIFINQIRDKIGVMFGSPETTTGGKALKFYASMRLDIRRKETKTIDDVKVLNIVRVKIVKNKVAAPFREAEVELVFGEGFSPYTELINLGVEKGLVEKSGTWYSIHGQRIGQGIEAAKQFVREHPDLEKELRAKLREILFGAAK
jgi:recombination protein RecA